MLKRSPCWTLLVIPVCKTDILVCLLLFRDRDSPKVSLSSAKSRVGAGESVLQWPRSRCSVLNVKPRWGFETRGFWVLQYSQTFSVRSHSPEDTLSHTLSWTEVQTGSFFSYGCVMVFKRSNQLKSQMFFSYRSNVLVFLKFSSSC